MGTNLEWKEADDGTEMMEKTKDDGTEMMEKTKDDGTEMMAEKTKDEKTKDDKRLRGQCEFTNVKSEIISLLKNCDAGSAIRERLERLSNLYGHAQSARVSSAEKLIEALAAPPRSAAAAAPPTPTYAEATAKPPQYPLPASPAKKTKKIIIKDSQKELYQKLKKAKMVMPRGLSILKNNFVEVSDSQSGALEDDLRKAGVDYRFLTKHDPKLTLTVPSWVDDEDVSKEQLVTDNPQVFTHTDDIREIFFYPLNERKTRLISIRVTPEAFYRLTQESMTITIGNCLRVKCRTDLRPRRCVNCQGYGHGKNNCRTEAKTTKPSHCFHCDRSDHNTGTRSCPIYQRHVRRVAENTDFGGGDDAVKRELAFMISKPVSPR